jgi:hypothetical protein
MKYLHPNQYEPSADLSVVSADLDELITDISGEANLQSGAPYHTIVTGMSATAETVFTNAGAGYVFISAFYESGGTGSAFITAYDGSIATENIIARGKSLTNNFSIICCGPCHYQNGLIVQVSTDGSTNCQLAISTIGIKPQAPFNTTVLDDTYINSASPTTNHGSEGVLRVQDVTGPDYKALIKFDLTSIPLGTQVQQASMYLSKQSGSPGVQSGNSVDFPLYAVLLDWAELQATWDDRLTATAWNASGMQSATDYRNQNEWSGSWADQSADEFIQCDITDVVNEWLAGTLDNNGLLMMRTTASGSNSLVFNSSTALNSAVRPYLELIP